MLASKRHTYLPALDIYTYLQPYHNSFFIISLFFVVSVFLPYLSLYNNVLHLNIILITFVISSKNLGDGVHRLA